MPKVPVLDLDAVALKAGVYLIDDSDLTNDAPLYDPVTYILDTIFNGDLDYLGIVTRMTATLSLGTVSAGGLHTQNTFKHFVFGAHGLPSLPLGILLVDGAQVIPGQRVQATANSGGRYFYLGMDATDVYLIERRITAAFDIPAVSFDLGAILIAPIAPVGGAKAFDINPTAGEISLGYGKFRLDQPTLKVKATAPEFFLAPPATTANHQNTGAMRMVWADGTFDDHGTYTGSFTGPTMFGMGE